MTVVSARGLVKAFGEGRAVRRVLDGADLDVAAGELVAVLGRSGSGKSTLLHLLGGLDRPDAGTVTVAGEPVTGASERALSALRRRRVGFVFQFFHLLPDEPTGNLDVEAGAEVLRLLRAGADDGRAVVLVTHEAAAAGIADRVLRLQGGRLGEAGRRAPRP